MGTLTFTRQIINWQEPKTTRKCTVYVKNKKQRAIEQFVLVSGIGQVQGQNITNILMIGNLASGDKDPETSFYNNYKRQERGCGFPMVISPLDDKLVIVKPFIYISFDGWTKDRNYACQIGNIEYCDQINFEVHHKNEVIMITQKETRKLQMLEAQKAFGKQYQAAKQACDKIYAKFNK